MAGAAVTGHSRKMGASFAKGRCVRGTYIPSDQAGEITRSLSFTRPSRVLARFTVGGGNSEMRDADNIGLRSFSFRLGDVHQRSEIVTQSAPVHFTRTLHLLRAFLRSRIPGPDRTANVDEVDAVSAVDPEMLHHASDVGARPQPGSFAGTSYWGVHAFPATNLKSETRFIKFKIAPVGVEVSRTERDARAKSADFLLDDLESRITARDVRFSVMALLDRPGDPVMDATIRWPDEDRREAVRLGTIVITGFEANEACDEPVFNPANLADGIGHPPDEIFAARRAAYAISRIRRG
ncbi:catalase [Bradyrhizobium sp. CB1650]|uniref:catalase n=1 Tax=Bradyrhizobium sp. CB1650 TaxID=3039153 RepID=UPI00243590E8|nr:catalase [Bradyrhizobium sp. CB1650]WGD53101.1 catalase [Bradyrhizobium sp. CB1650]